MSGVESELLKIGQKFKINRTDKIITLEGKGCIYFRTMDAPEKIIAYEVADSIIDELDTMKPEKAKHVYKKIRERNRQSKPDGAANTIGVITTPDNGTNGFVYELYNRCIDKSTMDGTGDYDLLNNGIVDNYHLIEARTDSNPFLPDGYMDDILEMYDPILANLFTRGKMVSLTQDKVYHYYNKITHGHNDTLKEKERVYIGIDFNVGGCGCVCAKIEGKTVMVFDEFAPKDTDAIVIAINNRFQGHKVEIFPDASGDNDSSNASFSDIQILRDGIRTPFAPIVNAPKANGAIRDRINSMNKKLSDNTLLIDSVKCPKVSNALSAQGYGKDGKPEKYTDHKGGAVDDWNDACFDGGTLVYVNYKIMMFKDIPKSGVIMGYDGEYKEYVNGGLVRYDSLCDIKMDNGTIIKATPDHKFLTLDGWVEAKHLKGKVLCNTQLYQKIYNSLESGDTTKERTDIFTKRLEIYKKKVRENQDNLFIEKLGNFSMVLFLMDILFIIKTKINQTTAYQILNSWKKQNIESTTPKSGTIKTPFSLKRIWANVKIKLKCGMAQTKENNGIKNTIRKCNICYIKKTLLSVWFAKKNTREQLTTKEICIAQETATQRREEIAELITNKERVSNVEKNLLLTNILKQATVQEVVLKKEIKEPTYCVTVPSDGCFALASGEIVSNCGYLVARLYPIRKKHAYKAVMES